MPSYKVTLREQKNKSGRNSLYLDIYPPFYDNKTKRETRRKFLDLYVFEKPADKREKAHNKLTMIKAKQLESEWSIKLLGYSLDMPFVTNPDVDFVVYFNELVKKRYSSKGNYDNWRSTYYYLKEYTNGQCLMSQVDEAFCQGFKDYLDNCYTRKSPAYKLSANSKHSYFNKFRAAIKQAIEDKFLFDNPILRVKPFPQAESYREFLTLEEVKKLKAVRCDNPVLEKAAFWSIRTGMRWGDCLKLRWIDIQGSATEGYYIRFSQNKTKSLETLPITEEAVRELGEPREDRNEYIFRGLTYSSHNNFLLAKWAMKAGINKHITFHCFRHTNATLLISAGEDIYTVSKMLGHKELRTTEVYAKVLNTKKIEAANRINF